MSDNVPAGPEPNDKLQCLDALMHLLGRAAARRAFQSDPWSALKAAGIPRDQAPWQFQEFVDAIADYSDEELRFLGTFGARLFELMGPEEWMF